MKNVFVFGGGIGLSHLLSGLKLFQVSATAKKYETEEQKDQVKIDKKEIEKLNCKLISDKLYTFSKSDGTIKHDSLKTSYLIFSYLMDEV